MHIIFQNQYITKFNFCLIYNLNSNLHQSLNHPKTATRSEHEQIPARIFRRHWRLEYDILDKS